MCCSFNLTPQLSVPLLARAVSSWSASSETHLNLSSSAGDVITALLSFSQGDVINVLQQRDDWWLGQLNGTQGWFPKGYVTVEAGGSTEYEDTHENKHTHTPSFEDEYEHLMTFNLLLSF